MVRHVPSCTVKSTTLGMDDSKVAERRSSSLTNARGGSRCRQNMVSISSTAPSVSVFGKLAGPEYNATPFEVSFADSSLGASRRPEAPRSMKPGAAETASKKSRKPLWSSSASAISLLDEARSLLYPIKRPDILLRPEGEPGEVALSARPLRLPPPPHTLEKKRPIIEVGPASAPVIASGARPVLSAMFFTGEHL